MARHLLAAIVIAIACNVVLADESDDQKVVDELFAKKIAVVKATSSIDDDIELAGQMLLSANDSTNSKSIRFILARRTLDLMGSVKNERAASLSQKAFELADQLGALSPGEKAQYTRQITMAALASARAANKSSDSQSQLARMAVEAELTFVELAAADDAMSAEANKSITSARGIASEYRLADLLKRIDECDKEFKEASKLRQLFRDGQARLDAARKANDAKAINLAARQLAQAYLDQGDLAAAVKLIEDTDDPRAKTLAQAVQIADDLSKADLSSAPQLAEDLLALAEKSQTVPAKSCMAAVAVRIAQAYLDAKPSDIGASKIKLLLVQLRPLAATAGADRILKLIKRTRGPLHAKLEVLEGQHVRVTYDFSTADQLSDWDVYGGSWTIEGGHLVCKAPTNVSAMLKNKILEFDRAKPVDFSTTATADLLELNVVNISHGEDSEVWYERIQASINIGAVVYFGPSGVSTVQLQSKPEKGKQFTLQVKTAGQDVTVGLDGQTTKKTLKLPLAERSTFCPGITTYSRTVPQAVVDSIVIEGTLSFGAKADAPKAEPKQPDDSKKADKPTDE